MAFIFFIHWDDKKVLNWTLFSTVVHSHLRFFRFLGLVFCFYLCLFKVVHGLETKAYHVILDPGHGGRDRGSVHGKIDEAQINLRIALLLEEQLQKEKAFRVSLTRSKNQSLSLRERIQFVQRSRADFLISLHVNSIHQAHARGMEIYIASPPILKKQQMSFLSPHNLHQLQIPSSNVNALFSQSKSWPSKSPSLSELENQNHSLRHILQDLQIERRFLYGIQLSKSLYQQWHPKKRDRPIRQAPFFILTQSPIPAVLIEMGFLSNPEERKLLQQRNYQEKIVKKIHQGILEFKKILDKG